MSYGVGPERWGPAIVGTRAAKGTSLGKDKSRCTCFGPSDLDADSQDDKKKAWIATLEGRPVRGVVSTCCIILYYFD